MSFFDEVDEPPTPTRTAPRRRRPSGSGRRPPGDQQSIQVRRARRRGGDPDRADPDRARRPQLPGQPAQQRAEGLQQQRRVADPAVRPDTAQLFHQLSSGGGSGNASNLQNQINETRRERRHPARPGRRVSSVPDEMKGAQQNLSCSPSRCAATGSSNIATKIQQALGTSTSRTRSTRSPPRWRASTPPTSSTRTTRPRMIAAALHAAGIGVGGTNGETIESGAVPARPRAGCSRPSWPPSSAPSTPTSQRRQARPGPARPLARLGQRRRQHAADRLDQHDPRQPGARPSPSTSPTAARTTRPTSSSR